MPQRTTATPDTDGPAMDLRGLAELGADRERYLELADARLEAAVDELLAAGRRANIALAAKLVGVSRDTLYARLERRAQGRGAGADH